MNINRPRDIIRALFGDVSDVLPLPTYFILTSEAAVQIRASA
jgi:hypothetical protein